MEKFPKPKTEKNKLEQPERKSGVVRIIGFGESKEAEALEVAGEVFSEKQELIKNEREKTPEEKEVIAFLNSHLPDFLKHYGARPLRISEDKIHIVPEKFFHSKRQVEAKYSIDDQAIFVKDDSQRPLLGFANRLAHEMIHFHAFQSLDANQESSDLVVQGPRRLGFRVARRGGETVYFRHVDEAITEELAKKFSKKFFAKFPVLQEEIAQLKKLADLKFESKPRSDEDFSHSILTSKEDSWEAVLVPFAYPAEREDLKELIDDLYNDNKGKFKSREEIFDLFARAAMSGRMLPVARLVEDTFGKGAFRDLGKSFEDLY